MLKKIGMTIGLIGIVTVLGFGVYHSNASQAEPTLSPDDIDELVKSQYPGTITELELDKDASGSIYEVEVVNDGIEYELKLDGQTGEIINLKEKRVDAKERASTKEVIDLKDKEKEQKAKEKEEKEAKEKEKQEKKEQEQEQKEQAKEKEQAQPKTEVNKSDPSTTQEDKPQTEKKENKAKNTVIDVNEAINIALAKFPGTVDEVELEEEDGRLIYEIEIEANGEEAEFEIDAYTGEIIVIEIEED